MIVVLLIIIACCLLFGAEATKSGLNGCLTIGLIILVCLGILSSCMSMF